MNKPSDLLQLERLCLRCGKCRSVCPSFSIRRDETYSPRGRIVQTTAEAHGNLPVDPSYISALEECLGCNACSAICPSGAAAERINNLAYRKLIASQGLPWLKKLVLRGLLRHGRFMGSAAEWSARLWTLTRQDAPLKALTRSLLPLLGLNRQRHLPRPARHAFYHNIPQILPPLRQPQIGTVVFFPGCGLRLVYPQTAKNAVNLLQHAGYQVLILRLENCCGRVALAHGDTATFNHLALKMQKVLAGTKATLVTACASCAFTLTKTYPEMGINDLPPVKELSQVLAESSINWQAGPKVAMPITYHDPCHLKHGLGITEPPRQLLRRAFGENYHEIEEPGACCGSAGSYHLGHYQVSRELGARRVEHIANTGAATVVTECPACMMFLQEMAFVEGASWKVAHLADVIVP